MKDLNVCTKTRMTIIGLFVMGFIVKYCDDITAIIDKDCKRCKTFPGGQISNWSTSHFMLCFITGLICPNQFPLVLKLSILWEIIEFTFEYNTQVIQNKLICKAHPCKEKPTTCGEFFDTYFGKNEDKFLAYCSNGYIGQASDIILNSSGYLLGAYLRKNFMS